MKLLLTLIAVLIIAALIGLSVMGMMSKSGGAPGLISGKLNQCPESPNCVCTEFQIDTDHYLPPATYSSNEISTVRKQVRAAINASGGELLRERDNYFVATYTSGTFGFVDDLEVRIEPDTKQIHIRSASRVGYSDLGANRERASKLKSLLGGL